MGLKVFKGDEASRDYENDFFREFASNLKEMFKAEDLDGILIGHPVVKGNSRLKPDCVLITKNRVVIVDFKKHGGKLWLPSGDDFENSPWRHESVIIGGGKSINPFEQLKRQKSLFEELVGEGMFDKNDIACVVCFQENMQIMNNVPGKFQSWFSVTNAYQYPNRIRDIIGVRSGRPIDIEEIASYFDAKPYHDYHPVSLEDINAVSEANEKLVEAERKVLEAKKKEDSLEAKISKFEAEKKSTEKLKEELESLKYETLSAKQAAEKAKKEFDDKKYTLELETQRATKTKAEADIAKSEAEKAYTEMEKEEIKSKTLRVVVGVLAVLLIVGGIVGIAVYVNEQNKIAKQKEDEAAQLEEDYKNGRKCIPVERAADYVGNSVCVDFYATYINDSKNFVFIDNAKNGSFNLMLPKKLISKEDAEAQYLNKHLNARGTISKYNDTYEIKITALNQLKVVE